MFLIEFTFLDLEKITEQLTVKHRAYLAQFYQQGTFLFGGRKEPRTGGIVISQLGSKQQVIDVLEQDPFVSSGAAGYTVTEFIPVMTSDQYSHLLTQS